jgi:hypothetical protein
VIGGERIPAHVVGLETREDGYTYHGFIRIHQRNEWVARDPERRQAVFAQGPRVLQAWKSFSIVLHPDDTIVRKLC